MSDTLPKITVATADTDDVWQSVERTVWRMQLVVALLDRTLDDNARAEMVMARPSPGLLRGDRRRRLCLPPGRGGAPAQPHGGDHRRANRHIACARQDRAQAGERALMPVAAALFVPESSHQWSCVMSRLRFSELFAAERSTASLYRLTGHHEKAEALAPLVPPQASPPTAAPALDLPELLALLTIANTPLAREIVQVLRSEGVTLHGPCFRALRALNWACITPRGYHELTPIGAAKADALAIEAARERGLHLPMFYRLRGHMRERASNGVRCTCGWSANTGAGGAGAAWNEHLQSVTQPDDNWRSLGEIVGPSIVPED